ncbi:jacalin-like lectin [Pseudoalteromonas rubra]|uniref:jacalin-like lectin n=1 Tax=Pseudoalteromonas rubra TaxID=43658 RepID=UPI00026CC71E|nr:hypothetical protein [Pseudoalteromonas rubra]
MTRHVCKALIPTLPFGNDVKISKVRVHWFTTDNGFVQVTGIQLKWRNNTTESDWSEMIGNGEPGSSPGIIYASQVSTFALSEGDYINKVFCVYSPPGGGWDTALSGIKFVTKNGDDSGYYGSELSEGATNSSFSIAHPDGQVYGISGSYEENVIFTVGFTGNFRTSDIEGS